jgi:O-antigen/teichoic acid export membrane protein
MIRNILSTTATRILNAIVNLIILIILTNEVGSDGFGIITIVLVALTVIQLIIDLLAGSTIIYFSSRVDTIKLLVPSYLWIIIVVTLSWQFFLVLNYYFPELYSLIIPGDYASDILLLSILNAIMLTHYNILLGKKRIGVYNYIFTIQILTLLLSLIYIIFILKEKTIDSWILSLYFSYGIGAILGTASVFSKIKSLNLNGTNTVIRDVLKFGIITQMANILHIGNKRLSIYFIKLFTGLSAVGVYGAGTQLTEGLRLIGQSISLVQFSEISNTNDKDFAIRITIKLMKFSVTLTILAVGVLLVIPTHIYEHIFGSDFNNLKLVIIALAPGVIALSANTIFSHYFGGLGRPVISLWGNLVGFIITIALAILLIPSLGFLGAACTASASYTSTVIYQYYIFRKETGTVLKQWVPNKSDFIDFIRIIKGILKYN